MIIKCRRLWIIYASSPLTFKFRIILLYTMPWNKRAHQGFQNHFKTQRCAYCIPLSRKRESDVTVRNSRNPAEAFSPRPIRNMGVFRMPFLINKCTAECKRELRMLHTNAQTRKYCWLDRKICILLNIWKGGIGLTLSGDFHGNDSAVPSL